MPNTIIKTLIFIILINITALLMLTSCSKDEKLKPLTPTATVIAFGDSLTYGTGTSRENAYPEQLARMTGFNIINAGIPGEISSDGLKRLPDLIKQHQPELIIICHGANDILRKMNLNEASNNIQGMIDVAKRYNSQVVLIAVPEFGLFLGPSPIYKALAEYNNVPLENDIIGKIISNNSLKSDHVHPNKKGFQRLAESIYSLLDQSGALLYSNK